MNVGATPETSFAFAMKTVEIENSQPEVVAHTLRCNIECNLHRRNGNCANEAMVVLILGHFGPVDEARSLTWSATASVFQSCRDHYKRPVSPANL